MLTSKNTNSDEKTGGSRWQRIYIAVIANTALVVFLIYLFSRHYGA